MRGPSQRTATMMGFAPPVAMTVAGSDSGGGAGIQADLRTFAALGVFGTSAITAVTAQNTTGVRRIDVLPALAVSSQIEAILDDLPVAAVKTGMLATVATIRAVVALAAAGRLPNLVVDPVMVTSSGAALVSDAVVAAYHDQLLPFASVITPNLREAAVLSGLDSTAGDDQEQLARTIGERTNATVVVKGGHARGDRAIDVVWHYGQLYFFDRPRLVTINTHGSGCTFAAALAAGLTHGDSILDAVQAAGDFVHSAIAAGANWHLGAGPGPLGHFSWAAKR